jgi:hypothetical protein
MVEKNKKIVRQIWGLTRYQLMLWGLDVKTLTINLVILLCLIVPGLEVRNALLQYGKQISIWELWLLFWSGDNTRIILTIGFFLNTLDEIIPGPKQYFALQRSRKCSYAVAVAINCFLKSLLYFLWIFVGLAILLIQTENGSVSWSDGMKMFIFNDSATIGLKISLSVPEKILTVTPLAALGMQAGMCIYGTVCFSYFCAFLQMKCGKVAGWIPVVVSLMLELAIRMDLVSASYRKISYLHLIDGNEIFWLNRISAAWAIGALAVIGIAGILLYTVNLKKKDAA